MKETVVISDQIKQLISGYLSDSLTPEELSVLKSWIMQSPENKKYFNEIRHTWALSGTTIQNKEFSVRKLAGKLSKRHKKQSRRFWTWQKVAASWGIIVICATSLWFFLNGDDISVQPDTPVVAQSTHTVIQAERGSQSLINLPDGTKVWLNGGSTLSYIHDYNISERIVELSGEACFDVVTNPDKPFVVKAGKLSIKALGTMFNVKAYPEDKIITTTLVKGNVVVEGRNKNDEEFSIPMKPNENITYLIDENMVHDAGSKADMSDIKKIEPLIPIIKEDNIKPELYTSWKDEIWVIEKQQLENLCKDLERRYNVSFVFLTDELKTMHFSGTIQRQTIEQVLSILQRTMPINFLVEKNVITLSMNMELMERFKTQQ
ncbi:MAG: DUF4974 domain-containing protein [Bacteroidales bacterium]|jgi:ferric-dicitrate binding protein FerR (iron transport regulator)|nr:DUF4974 domain-containing protein [Bacteroidales bacterium]